MNRTNLLTRREALRSVVVIAAGSALVACKKSLSCADETGLTPEDSATRKALEYVDRSTVPGKLCNGCQLYKPAAPDQCGGCAAVKGPIHPQGYCKSWVQKA